jgi:hypothetical protein
VAFRVLVAGSMPVFNVMHNDGGEKSRASLCLKGFKIMLAFPFVAAVAESSCHV